MIKPLYLCLQSDAAVVIPDDGAIGSITSNHRPLGVIVPTSTKAIFSTHLSAMCGATGSSSNCVSDSTTTTPTFAYGDRVSNGSSGSVLIRSNIWRISHITIKPYGK
mmetsp:Transcript_14716/g.24540  ORF Transcript_14716/g.24540 Transcript_14716/m.24540 type:complete len:107 (+) Transcript_14716:6-326(+)